MRELQPGSQKPHHHAANVPDDLDSQEKLGMLQQIKPCHAHQRHGQCQRAVDGIAQRDGCESARHCEQSKAVKEQNVEVRQRLFVGHRHRPFFERLPVPNGSLSGVTC